MIVIDLERNEIDFMQDSSGSRIRLQCFIFVSLPKHPQVLSDPDKKAYYDRTGRIADEEGEGGPNVDMSEMFDLFGMIPVVEVILHHILIPLIGWIIVVFLTDFDGVFRWCILMVQNHFRHQ